MADEAVTRQQYETQGQQSDAQGVILGEMPPGAQTGEPYPAYPVAAEANGGGEAGYDRAQGLAAQPMEPQGGALDVAQVQEPGQIAPMPGVMHESAQPQLEYQQTPVGAAPAMDSGATRSVPAQDPVKVLAITVRTGRMVLEVEIHDARFRHTTPRLSAFVNGQYPDLPHHACVNDAGNTFGYVMERTSVPHLLEHLIISEQVRDNATGADTFVGTTEWTNELAGLARIEVGFKDDLVALRAFNEATRFLNMAVLTCLA